MQISWIHVLIMSDAFGQVQGDKGDNYLVTIGTSPSCNCLAFTRQLTSKLTVLKFSWCKHILFVLSKKMLLSGSPMLHQKALTQVVFFFICENRGDSSLRRESWSSLLLHCWTLLFWTLSTTLHLLEHGFQRKDYQGPKLWRKASGTFNVSRRLPL